MTECQWGKVNSFFIVQILKYLVLCATPYCFEVGVRVGPSLLSARCAQHRLSRNRQTFMLELLMPFSSRKSQRIISGLHNTGKRIIYGFLMLLVAATHRKSLSSPIPCNIRGI